jgi:hypothetical protein
MTSRSSTFAATPGSGSSATGSWTLCSPRSSMITGQLYGVC